MAKVAFLGLGRMGIGMCGRLLQRGHEVRVFNRTAARADGLVARGAVRCTTPREACMGVDAVVSMVADDNASRALWQGPDGVLAATFNPGGAAIECSTLSHDWVLQLSTEASHRGLRYIDAPVTGLPDMAASGDLTLLVGASPGDLQAASPQVIRNTRRMAENSHDRDIAFTPQLRLKDVEYALALARKLSIGSPFGTLAGELFQQLCELGHSQSNESRIIEVALRHSPAPTESE